MIDLFRFDEFWTKILARAASGERFDRELHLVMAGERFDRAKVLWPLGGDRHRTCLNLGKRSFVPPSAIYTEFVRGELRAIGKLANFIEEVSSKQIEARAN